MNLIPTSYFSLEKNGLAIVCIKATENRDGIVSDKTSLKCFLSRFKRVIQFQTNLPGDVGLIPATQDAKNLQKLAILRMWIGPTIINQLEGNGTVTSRQRVVMSGPTEVDQADPMFRELITGCLTQIPGLTHIRL